MATGLQVMDADYLDAVRVGNVIPLRAV